MCSLPELICILTRNNYIENIEYIQIISALKERLKSDALLSSIHVEKSNHAG